ncbi:MAG: hypothetical protein U0359_12145 [Byssovorax sp.]
MTPDAATVGPSFFDVTLEQYAGVNAAILEGFALVDVLESEGLDERRWPRAAASWNGRLGKEGMTGALAKRYHEKLAFAQGWLGGRVEPLEADLAAWLGFLGAYSAHPAPFDLLRELGLRPADIARVQGLWARRMEAEEALREEAFSIAKKKPSAVPAVTVTRPKLRPFPWSRKAPARTDEETREMLLPSAHRPRSAARAVDPSLAAALAPPPVSLKLAGTALALDVPRGPALPFHEGAAPAEVAASSVRSEAVISVRAKLGGTALAVDVPRGPALPFGPESDAPASVQGAEQRAAPVSVKLVGTAPLLEVPRGPALPFDETAAPSPDIANPTPPEALAARSPAKLGGTAPVLDAPRAPVLPFSADAKAAPEVGSPPPEAPQTLSPASVAAVRKKLGQQMMGFEVPRNLPPARSAPKEASPAPLDPPVLTLEQHASLCAEIAFTPERTGEILGRYRLTPEAKAAVDQHYREKVTASAELRAAWNRAYQTYGEWLVSTRSTRGR